MAVETELYEILGVEVTADESKRAIDSIMAYANALSQDEIKKAYRKKVLTQFSKLASQ